jgi:hypothetical protein
MEGTFLPPDTMVPRTDCFNRMSGAGSRGRLLNVWFRQGNLVES